MSIFGKIKSAIFGDKGPLGGQFGGGSKPTPTAPSPAPAAHPPTTANETPAQPVPAPAAAAPAAPAQPVDVEQVLTGIAQRKGNPDLNWRTSIVDLMKLLDLDSSLSARKELADELGVHAAEDGTAEQNIALHRAVMDKLAENGGVVPDSLRN